MFFEILHNLRLCIHSKFSFLAKNLLLKSDAAVFKPRGFSDFHWNYVSSQESKWNILTTERVSKAFQNANRISLWMQITWNIAPSSIFRKILIYDSFIEENPKLNILITKLQGAVKSCVRDLTHALWANKIFYDWSFYFYPL